MTLSAKVRGLRAAASMLAMALALVAGCGSERPPPASDSVYRPAAVGGAGGFADAGTSKPPGCGQKDDGSFCDCIDVPLFTNPPNIYFVLDRSGSMAIDNKWDQVRVVVAKILRGLGSRANFGATVFPGFTADACGAAKEILPISPGDGTPGVDGPTTQKLLQTTAGAPNGGTPTAQALRSVLGILSNVSNKTFVVLATDGGPNCNSLASCGPEACMPNIESDGNCPPGGPLNCCEDPNGVSESCLDAAPTKSAVSALKAAGFPVYVVGLPGVALYASLLDDLAVAGGTALPTSPKYFRVDAATESSLLTSLKKVAAKIVATCEFDLKETPAAPGLVNVYLDEVILPADPVNGWKIDGAKVTLLGSACDKVLAGDVLGVRIISGCPTVGPR